MDGRGVADSGTIDDHKDAISALENSAAAAAATSVAAAETTVGAHAHVHAEEHTHSHDEAGTSDSDCSACHQEEKAQEAGAVGSSCAETTGQGHSHGHNEHAHDGQESDPDCAACNNEEEHGHGHDHSHSHGHKEVGDGTTTAAKRFGIENFVYRQRRPFHPERLGTVLKSMPSSSNLALSGITAAGANADGNAAGGGAAAVGGGDAGLKTALGKVVRSKGFMWLAFSDKAAMYWSHAGASFEVLCLGRWWDSLDRDMWPPGQAAAVMEDFEGEYGDRRQELVFIGIGMNEEPIRGAIVKALDECLLTDQEMEVYEGARESTEKLPEAFPSPLRIRFT
ncbi:unnamed protein product [Hapterophycus canaliculatus]